MIIIKIQFFLSALLILVNIQNIDNFEFLKQPKSKNTSRNNICICRNRGVAKVWIFITFWVYFQM